VVVIWGQYANLCLLRLIHKCLTGGHQDAFVRFGRLLLGRADIWEETEVWGSIVSVSRHDFPFTEVNVSKMSEHQLSIWNTNKQPEKGAQVLLEDSE
jgi:hypothetical protein